MHSCGDHCDDPTIDGDCGERAVYETVLTPGTYLCPPCAVNSVLDHGRDVVSAIDPYDEVDGMDADDWLNVMTMD